MTQPRPFSYLQSILIFYTDDLTGHYTVNFVLRTSCHSLSNLQTFSVGQDHFIIYLCLDVATGANILQGRRLVLSERRLGEGTIEKLTGMYWGGLRVKGVWKRSG